MIKEAAKLIRNAKNIVAFTGAGISVESGIPSFRGEDGLWHRYDPKCLDISYFNRHPKEAWIVIEEIFYHFFGQAKPNAAHYALARLEKEMNLKAVITQNIDNLHQAAGSKTVYEFHGSSENLVCQNCYTTIHSSKVNLKDLPPLCPKCKRVLKPNFVFFGEAIPRDAFEKSFAAIRKADVVLVIGSTCEVMPASMIPKEAKDHGAKIIEINPERSSITNSITDVYLKGKAGEIMLALEKVIFG